MVGGCASTSNVLAGKLFGIPVSGTHAHSWVMSFPDGLTAFREYARVMPKNCVLLVDTYDVEQGVRNAITVGLEMRERGERLAGIRIDSGDLAWLAKMARRMLDEAGLSDCGIVLSNDLDEFTIDVYKRQLMDEAAVAEVVQRCVKGGAEVVAHLKTGSAYYAPGASIAKMVEAILGDTHEIMSVCAHIDGQYGIDDLYMNCLLYTSAWGATMRGAEPDFEGEQSHAQGNHRRRRKRRCHRRPHHRVQEPG